MLRTLAARSPARRRGTVLIVVLAMLVLFSVVGLSFVLYSEAQLSAARGSKESENKETEPNPAEASRFWLGGYVYGVGDTGVDLMNPIRGHSLTRSKYGYQATTGVKLLPFSAPFVLPPEDNTVFNFNGITDSREIVRFTWDTNSANGIYDPERYYDVNNMNAMLRGTFRTDPNAALVDSTGMAGNNGTYVAKNYGFTYPDRHDFYLAQINPATGEIVVPSFHRPDLGSWNQADATYFGNQAAGRFKTLRPVPGVGVGRHPNFPTVPMDPDGQYRGDVSNLKFITGVQKNDSLWMYTGGPVLRWRGKNYVACVAPLILDLSSRVNLSVAGNVMNNTTDPMQPHGSNQGWGPWEVNPMRVGLTATDLQEIVARRHGRVTGTFTPPDDPFMVGLGLPSARINGIRHPQVAAGQVTGGRLPPAYARGDVDGSGPLPGMMAPAPDGPLFLPQPNTPSVAPIYNFNNTTNTAPFRYEPTSAEQTTRLTNHPSQFNPLLYARTPNNTGTAGGYGHDDFIKLFTHYSDPKNRPGLVSSIPPGTSLPTNNQLRQLVTTFSTSQQWAGVQVTTSTGTTVTLGPIDLNRSLPDFRKNPRIPASPINLWTPVGPEYPHWYRAHSARWKLARDIFIRLSARYGLINGTSAAYIEATGNLNVIGSPTGMMADPNVVLMAQLAQLAVNMVDYIDGDDIATTFVWRPTTISQTNQPLDPALDLTPPMMGGGNNFMDAETTTRVVYGTELPRLVLNEVYAGLFNETDTGGGGPLRRRYYIELHNPTPVEAPGDALGSAARSDQGAARLRYDPTAGVTLLRDPTTEAPIQYTGTNFNPYRIDVAEVPAAGIPYSTALNANGNGAAVSDPGALMGMTATIRLRVNTFAHDATGATMSALAGDEFNLIRPLGDTVNGVAGNGGNRGVYVIGPKEAFPAAGVNHSMSLTDPAGATPEDRLIYNTAPSATDPSITAEAAKTSVVILRRLLNPYLPGQENPALANFNPYVTVDFMENIPTRNRVARTSGGLAPMEPLSDRGSVGRVHPYAAGPVYQSPLPMMAPFPAVQDQSAGMMMVTPPHTFFATNNPADNNRTLGTDMLGYEWLVHLDRELTSFPEAAHVSFVSPARLTQAFYNGTPGTGYNGHAIGLLPDGSGRAYLADCAGLLGVGSRLPGVPLGGRVPGKINVNTMNSVDVLNAVVDPNYGNAFGYTNGTYANDLWTNRIAPATVPMAPAIARTPNNGVPRATVNESATGTDHPFNWGGTYAQYTDTPFGRRSTSDNTGPQIFPNLSATGGNPYLQYEPLRKAYNHLTPNSDSFLLLMTVGFFEVENAGPWGVTNQPQLGRELHDKVPGDLRTQFAGIVDRSQLFVEIVQNDVTTSASAVYTVPADPANNPAPRAVQTKLVSDFVPSTPPPNPTMDIEAVPPLGTRPDGLPVAAGTCAIPGDGFTAVIGAGSRIRIGYGDATVGGDGEWVTVLSVAQRQLPNQTGVYTDVPGHVTLTLAAPADYAWAVLPTRTHAAGSPVGNVVFGSPGPQPGVTLSQLKQRGIVPYFTKIEP